MKNVVNVLKRAAWVLAVWAVAGVAMADDCTSPPVGIRFARWPGSGIGGYDVVTERTDSVVGSPVWVSQAKNPAGNIYAPFWSANCSVPPGLSTQVLKFRLITSNYWSSGIANHIPVFALYENDGSPGWGFRGAGVALFPVTPDPVLSGVALEDWNRPPANQNRTAAALPTFQFQDNVSYNIQVNVTSTGTSVWVYDDAWNLLANTGAAASTYQPPSSSSRPMLGGYGFSVLCDNGTSYYGNFECEYATGPLQFTQFVVNISGIQVVWGNF